MVNNAGACCFSSFPVYSNLISPNLQPLSAYISSTACNSTKPPPPLVRGPSENRHAIHGLSLPTWVPAIPATAHEPTEKGGRGTPDTSSTPNDTLMQVAVMIAMPSRPREDSEVAAYSRKYEIGVAYEAWDSKLDPSSA